MLYLSFGGTVTAIISLVLLINISGKMTLFVLVPVLIFAVIALKAIKKLIRIKTG